MGILDDQVIAPPPSTRTLAPQPTPYGDARDQELSQPAAVTVAPPRPIAAAVVAPKTDPSFWERATGAYTHGLEATGLGAVARWIDRDQQESTAHMLEQQGQTEAAARIRAGYGVAQPSEVAYQNTAGSFDPRYSFGQKILNAIAAGPASLAGMATSPEGLVSEVGPVNRFIEPLVEKGAGKLAAVLAPKAAAIVERAAPATGRIASSAATQAGVQAGANTGEQLGDIATGIKKTFDPMEVVQQAVFGAALGGAIHSLGEAKGVLANAFQDWRIARDQANRTNRAGQLYGPPTRQEVEEFANSPVAQALREKYAPPPTPTARPEDTGQPPPEAPPAPAPTQPGAVDLRGRPITPTETVPLLDQHAQAQADIDAAVKQGQSDGTIKAEGYDHTPEPEAKPAPETGQGKTEGPVGEGAQQPVSADGGTVKSGDTTGGEGKSGTTGGETGGVKPGDGNGAGGIGETTDGGGQPDKPGSAQPASGDGTDGKGSQPKDLAPAPTERANPARDVIAKKMEHNQTASLKDQKPLTMAERKELEDAYVADGRTVKGMYGGRDKVHVVVGNPVPINKAQPSGRQLSKITLREKLPDGTLGPKVKTTTDTIQHEELRKFALSDEFNPPKKAEAPAPEAKKTEAPAAKVEPAKPAKAEAPKTEAPKTEAPKTEAPKGEPPKQSSSKVQPIVKATGKFEVHDSGHVVSDNGGTLRFATKSQAENWLDNVGSKAHQQEFQIEPRADAKGYTIREKPKETSVDSADGGAKAGKKEPVPSTPPEAPKTEAPKVEAKTEAPKKEAPKAEKKTAPPKEEFKHDVGKPGVQQDLTPDFEAFKKHGEYPDDSHGTARAIADYVISRGKATGHENGIMHDPKTNTILSSVTSGQPGSVTTNKVAIKGMLDAISNFIFHHNHPRSTSLSDSDLAGLVLAGQHWTIAHGHNGDFFSARLGAQQRKLVEALPSGLGWTHAHGEATDRLKSLFRRSLLAVDKLLKEAEYKQRITFKERDAIWTHTSNLLLDRKGHIDYLYSKEVPAHVQSVIDEILTKLQKQDTRTAEYRRAQRLRPDEGIERISRRERDQPASVVSGGSGKGKAGVGKSGEREVSLRRVNENIEAHEAADLEAASKSDGDTKAEAKEKVEANIDMRHEFYSNPVSDNEVWSGLSDTLESKFGWLGREASKWVAELKENYQAIAKGAKSISGPGIFGTKITVLDPAIRMAEQLLKDVDGVLRSRATGRNSPTLRKVADLFTAISEGVGAHVMGAKSEDYHSARFRHEGEWKNRYAKATRFTDKMTAEQRNSTLEQIGRLVQNPDNIVRGTAVGDAAHEIGEVFKEMHSYLRAAGVDVGMVRKGYLPRIEDTQRIINNEFEFKRRAVEAYKVSGVTGQDAVTAADDWFKRIVNGDYGLTPDGMPLPGHKIATPSNFVKGRVLTKEADNIMGDMYHQNVRDIVPKYVHQAVGRAEYSRRFGVRDAGATPPPGLSGKELADWRADPHGKWFDIKDALIKEGNGDLIPTLTDAIRGMTGNYGAPPGAYGGFGKAAVWLRTFNILGKLSYSVITSLAEPMTHAVQTGNLKDAITAYGGLIQHWVPALRKLGDGEYLRNLAEDLNIIGHHWDESSALQLTGGSSGTAVADKLVNKFFRLTGQHQFTEASRVTGTRIGMTFLRRLAKDVESGNNYQNISKQILSDFGVRDPVGFAKYVSSLDKPTKADLAGGGKHGEDYALALQRYVSRTVMHPTPGMKPLYAGHPLGSLLFALQSFNYAFKKQVLDRTVKMGKAAFDPKSGLNMQERLYALGPMTNLVPMAMVSYAVGEVRDAMLPDPDKADQEPMSSNLKWTRAVSRMGGFGYLDPYVNIYAQARYQTDVNTALAGPILGPVGTALGAITDVAKSAVADDDETAPEDSTAKSRKVAKSAWDVAIRPAMQSAVTMAVPGGAASRAAATAFTYWLADRRTRAAFLDAAGGEKDD